MTDIILHGYSGGYAVPIGAESGLPGRLQTSISGNIGITFTSSTTGSQGLILVGSPATLIRGPVSTRKSFMLFNNGSNSIYLGFVVGIAETTGLPLIPQAYFADNSWTGSWYGVSTGNTSTEIRFMEQL